MYEQGLGVPKDEQQAYFWWLLAAAQGNAEAPEFRDRIARRLTAQQRAAAQARARQWRPAADPALAQTPPAGQGARPAEPRGSGFRVAPGRVVTNEHVVAGCPRILVGDRRSTRLAADAVNDLAVIDVPGDQGAVAPLRSTAARLGEGVTIAGFPLEGLLAGLSVTSGNVSRLSGLGGDTGQLQISAPVQPGNSGGPVLDASGQVIGVVVSKLDALGVARATGDVPQNVNFAIKGDVLRGFLDAHGVGYQSSSGGRPLAADAIAERARQFTVLIQCGM
jgi:S1-C subfamily serine protease